MQRRLVGRQVATFVGLEGLHRAEDFLPIARKAVDKAKALIGTLERFPKGEQVVGVLDEISDTICRVADAANFCSCIHPDDSWRSQSAQAHNQMLEFVADLNQNENVFGTLTAALEHRRHASAPWSSETVFVAESFHRDFLQYGLGSSSSRTKTIRKTIGLECSLSMKFLRCATKCNEIKALSLPDISCLPLTQQNACVRRAGIQHLPMTPSHYGAVVHSVDNGSVRKAAYLAHYQSLSSNLDILQRLLETRQSWADALEMPSFAHLKLQDSIARDPSHVKSFLMGIAADVKPKAEEDMQQLARSKGETVFPWDIPYWTQHKRNEARVKLQLSVVSEFDLQSVVNGISRLLKDCMDLELHQLRVDVWDPAVQVFELRHADSTIGHLYLDPFMRKHKRPENAHYMLRCARENADGSYQNPIVALATNFECPRMTYHDLKTLLHEFGHALHALLSKCRYQHLSGIRGPLDLVEIPSHFFEKISTSPEALLYLIGTKQNQHGLLKAADLQQVIDVQSMFTNLSLLWQVQFALADQLMHDKAFHVEKKTTTNVMESVASTIGVIPHVHDTFQEAWMTHLTTYGARYYSYVFSRHIADIAWKEHIADDIFNKGRWEHIQKHLFQPGCAICPQTYVSRLIPKDQLNGVLSD